MTTYKNPNHTYFKRPFSIIDVNNTIHKNLNGFELNFLRNAKYTNILFYDRALEAFNMYTITRLKLNNDTNRYIQL